MGYYEEIGENRDLKHWFYVYGLAIQLFMALDCKYHIKKGQKGGAAAAVASIKRNLWNANCILAEAPPPMPPEQRNKLLPLVWALWLKRSLSYRCTTYIS